MHGCQSIHDPRQLIGVNCACRALHMACETPHLPAESGMSVRVMYRRHLHGYQGEGGDGSVGKVGEGTLEYIVHPLERQGVGWGVGQIEALPTARPPQALTALGFGERMRLHKIERTDRTLYPNTLPLQGMLEAVLRHQEVQRSRGSRTFRLRGSSLSIQACKRVRQPRPCGFWCVCKRQLTASSVYRTHRPNSEADSHSQILRQAVARRGAQQGRLQTELCQWNHLGSRTIRPRITDTTDASLDCQA